MLVRYADKKLERLEFEAGYTAGFGPDIIKAFRKRMQYIRQATNEQDFYRMRSMHYEKLKGKRSHQRSMRLNDQFRLILEIQTTPDGRTVVVVSVEDYH